MKIPTQVRVLLPAFLLGAAIQFPAYAQIALRPGLPHVVEAKHANAQDCSAGIEAAEAELGASPGIIQISNDCTISRNIVLSAAHSLQFTHAGVYHLDAPIVLKNNCTISGLPNASGDSPVQLIADRPMPFMIQMGAHSVVRDILIDGNHQAQDGILVSDANRVHIMNTTVRFAARDDLHITSSDQRRSSSSGYLGPNVVLGRAGRDAMFASRVSDWIMGAQVEFESAGRDGLHGEDASALRCTGCDFGGNGRYGAASITVDWKHYPSCGWVIVGSQFGNNRQGDFYASGGDASLEKNGVHTLTGDAFIQEHTIPNTYNSITLVDAGGDTISGNTWGFVQPTWATPYKYIVMTMFRNIPMNQRYRTTITGNNILPGTFATAAFRLDSRDVTVGNVEGNGPSVSRNITEER